jgi:type II secretory pathway component PulC
MVRLFTKHFWVINLLFIAAAAWLVAHLFAVVIQDRLSTFAMPGPAKGTGPAPAEKTAPYDRYAVILERNVFNPQEKGLKLLPLEDRGSGAAGPRNTSDEKMMTSGSYRLVGTVTGPGSQSWAVLQEGADRKQKMVPLGGDVDGGKIIQIFRNRIVIRRRGREEVLSIMEEDISPGPAASPATSTGEVVKKLSANPIL